MSCARVTLSDPLVCFKVTAGKVDVFLASPGSALAFLFRAEAGEVLLGLPMEGGPDLVAVPGPESSLEAVTECPADIAIGLWCQRVSAAAAPHDVPRNATVMRSGWTLPVSEHPSIVSTVEECIWVRQTEGSSFLFGKDSLCLAVGDSPFPITRSSWLELAPNACVEGAAAPTGAERLDRFRQVMAVCLLARHTADRIAEQDRLTSRTLADARMLDFSLRNITTPLQSGSAPLFADANASSEPLFGAISAVCANLGLKMVSPPSSLSGKMTSRKVDVIRENVAAIARSSGVSHRQVTMTGEWWKGDAGPILGFRNIDNSPVAILPISPVKYVVFDPITHVRTPVDDALSTSMSGLGYVFYRPFPTKALTAVDLLKFGFLGCRQDARVVLLAGLAAGALGMLTPLFTRVLYNTIIPESRAKDLYQLAAFLTASTIAGVLFTLARGYAVLRVENRMNSAIQAAVWDRLLGLPAPFFRRFSSGDLSLRSMGIDRIRAAITSSALNALLSGMFSIFNFVLLFWFSWRLAMVATGLTAISVSVLLLISRTEVGLKRSLSAQEGKLNGLTLEILRGISKFRVAGAEGRAFSNWSRAFAEQQSLAARSRSLSIRFASFQAAFPVFASIALFYTMSLADKGSISTGEYLAFSVSFTQFLMATLQLATGVIAIAGVLPLYERARPILEALPESAGNRRDPGDLTGRIEISHIAFRYKESAPQVLKDVCIKLEPGQFVAFVGGSGCGKSTLFRLLLGFEAPESGRLYFDNQDLADLDLPAVRRQMGVVLQNARLSAGSILSNILGSAALTIDDAWHAATMAGLDGDIKALPMGMHTMISDGGGTLSGGQRQRILIARALVRKPRILLFDEATSALDNRTQAIVSESLERLRCTRVVIAHRLSTIRKADLICYLDKGVIAEAGTYEELLAKGGLFAQLARRQIA